MPNLMRGCRPRVACLCLCLCLVGATRLSLEEEAADRQSGNGDIVSRERSHAPSTKRPANTYAVLSYNVCWGCMEGDRADKTGMSRALAEACVVPTKFRGPVATNGLGNNSTVCADNMGKSIASYSNEIGGYDFMGFQEASNFDDLRLGERGIKMVKVEHGEPLEFRHIKGPKLGQVKNAWIVSLYDQARVGKHDVSVAGSLKSEIGRPFLVLVFDTSRIIFANVHNVQPGRLALLGVTKPKPSWKGFPAEIAEKLASAFAQKPERKQYRFIATGDFNDLMGALPGQIVLPWNQAVLNLQRPLPETCCSSMLKIKRKRFGDYIFDSETVPTIRLPARFNYDKPQSDHVPVEAILGSASTFPPPPLPTTLPNTGIPIASRLGAKVDTLGVTQLLSSAAPDRENKSSSRRLLGAVGLRQIPRLNGDTFADQLPVELAQAAVPRQVRTSADSLTLAPSFSARPTTSDLSPDSVVGRGGGNNGSQEVALVLTRKSGTSSCKGLCRAKLKNGRPCQCNLQCTRYGDCCKDYNDICKGIS